MPRRNRKLVLKTEEELAERRINNSILELARQYKRKNKVLVIDNRTPCQKQRKVEKCEQCCRFSYCKGLSANPYVEKTIDLFLNTKLER